MILIDMDGTCLNTFKRISKKNLEAMKMLQSYGVTVVPASGRAMHSLPKAVFEDPSFRYVMTSNGARLTDRDSGEIIFREEITPEESRKLLDLINDMPVTVGVQAGGRYYLHGGRIESIIGGFAFASDLEQVTMCDDLLEHVNAADGAEKFSLFYHHPGIRNKVTELIGSEMNLRISRGFIYSEVCAEKAGKGNALKTLQEHLHIAKEECACIGDGDNDITMFENCGLRFAPKNACRDIREMADHIVSDNDHDCVWEAVRIMMEQKCI